MMQARTMQQSNVAETIIGAVVVAVAVLFLVFAYKSTGGNLSGYEITARLAKVDGLGIGTDVRISGIKVGTVSDLTLDPKNYLVTVHMDIHNDIKIPTDSSMIINSAGILGSSYLSITPGGDDTMLAAGGQIVNTQSVNSNDIMGMVNRFVNSGGGQANSTPAPKPAAPSPGTP